MQGTSASSSVNDASLDISYSNYSPPVDTGTAEFTVFDAEILGVDPNAIAYGGGGATITYEIKPNSGWSPSEVKLIIGSVRTLYPGEGVGVQTEYWDGKTDSGSWAETGAYDVKLEVSGSGTVSDTFFKPVTVTYIDVDITTPSSFPVYVKAGEELLLICATTPYSGDTCTWQKYSGEGGVTFQANPEYLPYPDRSKDFIAYTPGTYKVKVTYTNNGGSAYDISGDIIVVDYFIGAADPRRVAVNYDDDDEDSVGDIFDGFNRDGIPNDDDLNPDENDLVMICPRVDTPILSDIVKLSVLPEYVQGSIMIWSSHDKQELVIPSSDGYYETWPAEDLPKELWVEGIGSKSGVQINNKLLV